MKKVFITLRPDVTFPPNCICHRLCVKYDGRTAYSVYSDQTAPEGSV